jgi:hypothetical protein
LVNVSVLGWREPLPVPWPAFGAAALFFGEAMSCPDERADTILSTPTHITMKALPVLQIRASMTQCSERNFKIQSEGFLKFET